MNERSAGICLQLILNINLIAAQIQFPDEPLVSDLTAIRVDRNLPPNYQTQLNSPSQQDYPLQQGFRIYPLSQSQQNYPLPQSQQNYPFPQSQQDYPSQQSQDNYPSQQSQDNYPSQQSHQSRPSQPSRKKSPSRQNHQNTTPPQNQQNYPSQQSQQDRTAQPTHQNSPGQTSQSSASQRSRKNSVSSQNHQSSAPQQGRQKYPQQQIHQSSVQGNLQNVAKVVANGFTKMILDVNRVAPTVSPILSQADNVVYGPVTVAGALAMVLLASIGQTFNEVANLLGLSALNIQSDPFYIQEQISRLFAKMETTTGLEIGQRVNFATAIFVQQDYPIRSSYQSASALLYQSNIMNLDFQGNPQMAMDVINAWVSGRTNAKIPTLLAEPPPQNTKAIIASVMYFQAAWQFPFFDGGTQWRPFYINGRKNPSDRMALMMSNGGEFPYHKDSKLGVEIMGFPYKGKATTMYVIMPIESNKEKLKKFENSVTPADIDHLVNLTTYTEAVVLFPKMKLETTINLTPTLQRLGVTSLFNPHEANLALLSEGVNQRYNEAPFVSQFIPSNIQTPTSSPSEDFEDRLIFTRFGDSDNCIPVVDPVTNVSKCQESAANDSPVPLSTRAGSIPVLDTLSSIREQLLQNPSLVNPGLYADQVIHKVYIDITESGTEAAAATGISLNRSGDRVTFRVDIPFLFFIYHEETKVILFWGSVKSPTPTVARNT